MDPMLPQDPSAMPPAPTAPSAPAPEEVSVDPSELAHELTLSENDEEVSDINEIVDSYKTHRNPNKEYKYLFDDLVYPWYKEHESDGPFNFSKYRNWLVTTDFTSMTSNEKWAEYLLRDRVGHDIMNRYREVILGQEPLPYKEPTPPMPEEPPVEEETADISVDEVVDGLSDESPAGDVGSDELVDALGDESLESPEPTDSDVAVDDISKALDEDPEMKALADIEAEVNKEMAKPEGEAK